jgi:2-polyprenyl-3-methyl-5-hydroxy-6-metoxy-1,4-benzoquinol methylase
MNVPEERIQVWDKAQVDEDKGFLSGSEYQETLDYLLLTLKKGDKVLEIGVGMGFVTKELSKRGFDVSGFDISEIALKRVKGYCTAYGFNDLYRLPINYFDVILCNHVVHHIPTELLKYELWYFIRSLKEDGIMAIKSISADGYEDTDGLTIKTNRLVNCDESIGIFCRSIPFFTKIVNDCEGKLSIISDTPCYVNERFSFITGTQIYHVTK